MRQTRQLLQIYFLQINHVAEIRSLHKTVIEGLRTPTGCYFCFTEYCSDGWLCLLLGPLLTTDTRWCNTTRAIPAYRSFRKSGANSSWTRCSLNTWENTGKLITTTWTTSGSGSRTKRARWRVHASRLGNHYK